MKLDLELPKNKRKKAKLDKIFTTLHYVVEEFNRWAALGGFARVGPEAIPYVRNAEPSRRTF